MAIVTAQDKVYFVLLSIVVYILFPIYLQDEAAQESMWIRARGATKEECQGAFVPYVAKSTGTDRK